MATPDFIALVLTLVGMGVTFNGPRNPYVRFGLAMACYSAAGMLVLVRLSGEFFMPIAIPLIGACLVAMGWILWKKWK